MDDEPKLASLRRGLLEPLVLASVETRPRYAAEILGRLADVGFPAQEGTLYPLLSRLRREGLVGHEWRESTQGPPRKYVSLTDAGQAQLREFRTYWDGLSRMIEGIGR